MTYSPASTNISVYIMNVFANSVAICYSLAYYIWSISAAIYVTNGQ